MSLESATSQSGPAAAEGAVSVPLCVDLDGTLVKSDTLLDTVIVLARQNPSALLHFPMWIDRGKAVFKREVSLRAAIDVVHLPYNQPLLEYLRQQHAEGREIYLATGADTLLAERVAAHLGIFAGVLASDGSVNLTGHNKLAAFQQRFPAGFCYIGNARPDVPLLTHCVQPMVANPHGSLRAGLRSAGVQPLRTFSDAVSPVKAWLRAIRLHQWAKNALIFLPVLLAHVRAVGPMVAACLAFLSFGLAASATYIFNDLLDLESDRNHPAQAAAAVCRGRPLADCGRGYGGRVSCRVADHRGAVAACSAGPVTAVSVERPGQVSGVAGDLCGIDDRLFAAPEADGAGGCDCAVGSIYHPDSRRLGCGSGVPVSPWLAAFSIFFFLSLAFVKRFSELESVRIRSEAGVAIAVKGTRISHLRPGADPQLRHGQRVCVGGRLRAVHRKRGGEESVSALFAIVAAGPGAAAMAEPVVASGVARRAARGPRGICDYGQTQPAAGRGRGGDCAVGAVRWDRLD